MGLNPGPVPHGPATGTSTLMPNGRYGAPR